MCKWPAKSSIPFLVQFSVCGFIHHSYPSIHFSPISSLILLAALTTAFTVDIMVLIPSCILTAFDLFQCDFLNTINSFIFSKSVTICQSKRTQWLDNLESALELWMGSIVHWEKAGRNGTEWYVWEQLGALSNACCVWNTFFFLHLEWK